MADQGRGVGVSRYRGLRVTLSVAEDSPYGYVHVSAKRTERGWDEYEALMPYFRIPTDGGLNSSRDALLALRGAIDAALLDLG